MCFFVWSELSRNLNGDFAMNRTQPQQLEDDVPAGDLLVGREAILAFLVGLGMPQDTDVYYLRRTGRWPIGKTSGDGGGSLIASKRRLARHTAKLTRGATAA
jgi:hypothetical protein